MRPLICFMSLVLLVFLVSGCAALNKESKDKEEVQTVEDMYNEAHEHLKKKRYKKAIEKFEEVERTYPYAKWALKSQMMAAYAHYEAEEYDDALLTLERFIKLHPGYKRIDYAYYLRALCYYEQISDIDRDQSYSSFARKALNEVIARFPNSKYSKDAALKLDLVIDHLAGKELAVGRFYLSKGRAIAAINRFKVVVEKYETTAHIEEALHRLVESYMMLGVVAEAQKYAAVLGHNYPDSKWYGYSYDLLQKGGSGGSITMKEAPKAKKIPFYKRLKLPFVKGERNKMLDDIS